MAHRILVANRGEIAVRVIRAAHDLGHEAVAVYSDADKDAMHVRLADDSVSIGPPMARQSYLDIEKVVGAARTAGCDLVHPGYGFLAESAAFAAAVSDAGMGWLGPEPGVIERLGDKAEARRTAAATGVPTVPGTDVLSSDSLPEDLEYPVMIKAAAGGGGRGIRIVNSDEELAVGLADARREAGASFGDESVYLEKMVTDARHIEVQVLGNGSSAIHLGERDCSIQRNRQKLIEESPSPVLPEDVRSEMCAAAVALAEGVGYRSAGTVEFLYDPASQEFYFIEMNTRIQVEHPVTEELTGVDLVAAQVRLVDDDTLPDQEDITPRGHVIELRINAEDPDNNWFPSPGTITDLYFPQGPGVRVDAGVAHGDEVVPFYDSLVAKLIVSGAHRGETLRRAERALGEMTIEGIATTAPIISEIITSLDFLAGEYSTVWLERWMTERKANG